MNADARSKHCTVYKCENPKNVGDSLFCRDCREEWRVFCELEGLRLESGEGPTRILLSVFQERRLVQ